MRRSEARAILRLRPGFQPAELEAAYRRAVRRTHPDHGGDATEFEAVVEAHRALLKAALAGPVVIVDDRHALERMLARLRHWHSGRPPRVI